MAARMMKAIRVHEPGGPEVLRHEEAPVPEAGPGEVLVRVHAAGINPPDWYARFGFQIVPEAMRPKLDYPCTPGTDVSGVVDSVAEGVRDFAPGDEVFGLLRFPSLKGRGYAECVTAPAAGGSSGGSSRHHLRPGKMIPIGSKNAYSEPRRIGHAE